MNNQETKILLIGADTYDMYASAFYHALKALGYHNLSYVKVDELLVARSTDRMSVKLRKRFNNKTSFGYYVYLLNQKIRKEGTRFCPNLVFVYNVRAIYPKTLRILKKNGAKIYVYSNDDPFASFFPWYFWRLFKRNLQFADYGFVYRAKNIEDFIKKGCTKVHLLRSYYIEEKNFVIENLPKDNSLPQVLFLGHYETDERGEYIKALALTGIKVGIMTRGWENYENENRNVVKLKDTHKRYNGLLNQADIAIVFLSKINSDTYTRRCFEIPATKTLMIAPYNKDLAGLFEEDKEAVFFRNKDEFVDKIQYYLKHEEERAQIAQGAYDRIMRDGHEVKDRVKQVMNIFSEQ